MVQSQRSPQSQSVGMARIGQSSHASCRAWSVGRALRGKATWPTLRPRFFLAFKHQLVRHMQLSKPGLRLGRRCRGAVAAPGPRAPPRAPARRAAGAANAAGRGCDGIRGWGAVCCCGAVAAVRLLRRGPPPSRPWIGCAAAAPVCCSGSILGSLTLALMTGLDATQVKRHDKRGACDSFDLAKGSKRRRRGTLSS